MEEFKLLQAKLPKLRRMAHLRRPVSKVGGTLVLIHSVAGLGIFAFESGTLAKYSPL